MQIKQITQETFETEVLGSDKVVLADFNAGWCGPCRMLRPILDELAAEREDVQIVSIDIDEEDELADAYDVSSIPCMVVFRGGAEVNRMIGLHSKDDIIGMLEG